MKILRATKEVLLDYLFPRSAELESFLLLSAEEILSLREAWDPKDKGIVALFDYSHPTVKLMVWETKYKGNREVACKASMALYDSLVSEAGERNWSSPVLIPIPISAERRLERGWNQAELLLEGIRAEDSASLFSYETEVLEKVRHTESQTKKEDREERLANLPYSMQVRNPERIRNRPVIVIDDVTTTGATFREARRALQNAGVKKILCVALAH